MLRNNLIIAWRIDAPSSAHGHQPHGAGLGHGVLSAGLALCLSGVVV